MSNTVFIGAKEYFPGIGKIGFEGRDSDNPLAFKVYDANKQVAGKSMAEHLRFAVAYWHSFCGNGADPFGPGTRAYPWDVGNTALARAEAKSDAAFEFFTKLGVPYYCFHDIDLAPDADDIGEYENNLKHMVRIAKQRQADTGVKLLWGTANLFSHPRYMNGASTNPDFNVVARAAVQVKAAIDATVELGGENYVFWGGREGYACLHNTQMKREQDNMARFLTLARDYGRAIGFTGNFLIEPKPMEPMKHQYDFDSATVIGFLHQHGLDQDFKLNIEANHATLSGHSFEHDLQVASDAGLLGSIDANRGNPQNGWDTDQFPTDLYDTVGAMLVVLRQGGLAPGGLNFDAKVRRESSDPQDLFLAHIGGMDAFARGLEVADALLTSSPLETWRAQRYASFDSGAGADFANGTSTLADLAKYAAGRGEPTQVSGRQEAYENLINQYLTR
ncbi:xylose isomerase [Xanthomonas campestris pv. campestris]|uniref:Xylose isomerase 1 n=6 Tax=Xanthomonas campestris TaxID=339 RepID=XYLA1_XANCP|nr:xylose isomerase [Xanthomonas campestris]Q4UTU6.1 RecName: Full=Xylose isomerase 1 [Xanthomonas campestris pv. campestris str. 8004]Q8P9T9.1 RecName: Full=Xylose isomerase 1 [Xanthomonas campestris pv. campestris str. ATCC 33913]AAM41049.1 xylose isomerase [Xanthomonas campestris pv. campestris str. ATCC 33913]AAY49527.1 xylose isomerase [Xanthomonas campestris pv. campestris str. 8004]AKS16513.1 xylose isomerase [Xanthomonas campestris pv. campestris]AKS20539.1 xylose isomerase [Xanthomon